MSGDPKSYDEAMAALLDAKQELAREKARADRAERALQDRINMDIDPIRRPEDLFFRIVINYRREIFECRVIEPAILIDATRDGVATVFAHKAEYSIRQCEAALRQKWGST